MRKRFTLKRTPIRGAHPARQEFVVSAVVVVPPGTAPEYSFAQEGDVTDVIVAVTFTLDIVSPGADYSAGFTFTIDGVGATISDATRQADHTVVHFTIAEEMNGFDRVVMSYDDLLGDIEAEVDSTPMADIPNTLTENRIGTHHWFNSTFDSGHLVHL